jgi:hypothetical protein
MLAGAAPALAADTQMIRVLTCQGVDAKMELFLPNDVWKGLGVHNVKLDEPAIGTYTLDLSPYGKGKHLESVRVSFAGAKKFVVVDQYQRGLPPTKIPV